MKVLLTGASGFVGSHVLRHLLMNTDWDIVAPVSFRHRGLPARIASAVCDRTDVKRVEIVHWDMRAPADAMTMSKFEGCDVIMNVASESHVDRSIEDPAGFVTNNTALILHMLEVARKIKPKLFLQMSTDEVYGPAYGSYRHVEWDTIAPSNPYAASKAAQEAICFSQWRTYGVPVVITNTMNILGEMQDPEKFLPMIIRNLLKGLPITVHCNARGEAGSRFYLHARNLADAWLFLTNHYTTFPMGVPRTAPYDGPASYAGGATRPDRFHIVGDQEIPNDVLVRMIEKIMLDAGIDIPPADIDRVDFHSSRPGHDHRYALDGTKIEELGWHAPVPLIDSLDKTVRWSLEHPDWLDL